MISVSVVYQQSLFESLTIKGHGSQGQGYDLVCAGVSSCFVGAMNALAKPEALTITVKAGDSSVIRNKKLCHHDEIVLETLIRQLQTIAKSYKDDCRVKVSMKEGNK
jgi:uncharacterized protein YsxB (DUF464 family)